MEPRCGIANGEDTMSTEQHGQGWLARRSFLSRASAGAAAFAAAFGARASAAPAAASTSASREASTSAAPEASGVTPDTSTAGWQPARHAEDDWFEQTPAKHRFFFDTAEPAAFGQAIHWARNFFEASTSGYGLTDADAALIICARHASTAFAFSDAMWAKYGQVFSERSSNFVDPKTKQVPVTNLYLATGYGDTLKNNNMSLDVILKRGVRLAVCGMATRRLAGLIAQKYGTATDDVFKELTTNLVPNAHVVPAGIVAVSRAQERGYTIAVVV
jgi:intracellular sulfur oxidation DsrE/DsrF family protein